MYKLFSTLILIIIGIVLYFYMRPNVDFKKDTSDGIQFSRNNWSDILSTAKKENKIIFLDIYATWCGPCKRMKKYVFTDKKVGAFFNKNFINISLDAEHGEGIEICKNYSVESYPTMLIIDPNGKLISKNEGTLSASELIEFGTKNLR